MTSNDAHHELLISAYVDGELSSDERQYVEQLLATNAQYRQLLDELRVLAADLRDLPRSSLDDGFAARIVDRTRHLTQLPADPEASVQVPDELLGAFVDGELTEDQLAQVQRLLESDDRSRRRVQQLQGLQATLRSLPTYTLDDDFADRVMRLAEEARLAADQPETAELPETVDLPEGAAQDDVRRQIELARPAAAGDTRGVWRGVAWSLAAVAAALLLAFFVGRQPDPGPDQIAATHQNDVPDGSLPQDQPPPASVDPEDQPPPPQPGERSGAPGERTPDSAWPVVLAMQQNGQHRFILVYEVSVTSWGAEQAVFAKLLARHNIGIRDTVAVGEDEQRDLLKRRYLEGAEIAPANKPGMDELRLYLVSCTANQADAMYTDLAGAPPGFASFSLNLTTGEAGGGVLNRLCRASEITERTNEAVQLITNLAIFSRTARNLGVFGTIEWVDPELLVPPAPSGTDQSPAPQAEAEQDDEQQKLKSGEFPCELLFVVRRLQPVNQ
jgi:anti-sigma factor RsiW